MSGTVRRYFPGNNTPEGFFSYYGNVQNQSDATKIWYLKGGPGTGKSTLIRRTGESLCKEGEQIDFLHCSSDSDSLDGVLIKDKGFAILDGSRPHLIDPLNPGAVDTIVYLGELWDEKGLRRNKENIVRSAERIKGIYDIAYRYLAAAGKIYDAVSCIEFRRIEDAEYYNIAEEIIGRELPDMGPVKQTGFLRRYFAGAITPKGNVNFIESLASGYKKIYLIHSNVGSGSCKILDVLLRNTLSRGLNAEACYCSMKPGCKIEHLLIPELSLALFTSNEYHKISPGDFGGKAEEIDIEMIPGTREPEEFNSKMAGYSKKTMRSLLADAIACLAEAKAEHDVLESYYIPHMDFEGIEKIRAGIEAEIRRR